MHERARAMAAVIALVAVVGAVTNPGDACLDLVEVTLDEPLGDRTLVDLATGRTVPVGHNLGVDP